MQAIIGGPWVWSEQRDPVTLAVVQSAWVPPPYTVLGTLDLSDVSQQGVAVDQQARGNGLWLVDVPDLQSIDPSYTVFATDTTPAQAMLTGRLRGAFSSLFRVALPADVTTIESACKRTLMELSDPTGAKTNPLMPVHRGGGTWLDIHFGPYTTTERLTATHPHAGKWRDMLRRSVREIANGSGDDVASKFVGFELDRMQRDSLLKGGIADDIIPTDLRGRVVYAKPETTISHDFNSGSPDYVNDWFKTPGGVDTTHTDGKFKLNLSGTFGEYRIERHALSSADQSISGETHYAGDYTAQSFLMARQQTVTSTISCYEVSMGRHNTTNLIYVRTRSVVAGVPTTIASGADTVLNHDDRPHLTNLKLVCNGSTIDSYYNDVLATSVTNSTHPGGLYHGVWFVFLGGGVPTIDDYLATDGLGGGGGGVSNTTQLNTSSSLIRGEI